MSTNTDWILTYSGKKFFPLNPNRKDIDILDIAHALSNLCRFTGHCQDFYSVAQHSVLVAERVWEKTCDCHRALHGLLHDASEAYLIDVPRPVKHAPEFHFYRQAENLLQREIQMRFGLSFFDDEVELADKHLLQIEAYFLMPKHPDWSLTFTKPADIYEFECWSPRKAKDKFLSAFLDFQGSQKLNFQTATAQSL